MLVECSTDISVGLESRRVPVVLPPASSSSNSSGGRSYPLFAYSVESLNNPLVSSAQCCNCVDDCRKNRNCPCRLRYAAGLPYDGDTDNLRQGAMTMKVGRRDRGGGGVHHHTSQGRHAWIPHSQSGLAPEEQHEAEAGQQGVVV